jgi:hypothetical protein
MGNYYRFVDMALLKLNTQGWKWLRIRVMPSHRRLSLAFLPSSFVPLYLLLPLLSASKPDLG